MKILFLVDKLFNKQDPTVDIAKTIAAEWQKQGHTVLFACNYPQSDQVDGCKVYGYYHPTEDRITDFLSRIEGKSKWKRLIAYAHAPHLWSQFYGFYFNEYKSYARIIAECVETIDNIQHIDMVYSISEPHYTAYGMALARIKAKKRAYFADPYSHNECHNYEKAKVVERLILEQVEKLTTAISVYKCYEKDEYFKPYMDKIQWVEFPTFKKPLESVETYDFGYDRDDINCVYAGNLFYDSRNPENMLKLFSEMEGPVLHIYGKGCEDIIDKYANKSGGRIIRHGFLPSEQVPYMLQQADVLVSLNNSIPNMVPSKLFQYFATGKPIINMCYFAECPTLPYTARYPVGYDIIEGEYDVHAVLDFCKKNKGKTLDYDIVEELYKQATPEYVAKELLT